MTFEEFLAACRSAQVVSTTDGTALLVGTTVIQFKGDSWAEYFAKALQLIPPEAPEPPAPADNTELIAMIDKMIREQMAEIALATNA